MLLRLCHPTARTVIPTPRNGPSTGPTPDAVRLEPRGEQVRAVVEEWAQAGDGNVPSLGPGKWLNESEKLGVIRGDVTVVMFIAVLGSKAENPWKVLVSHAQLSVIYLKCLGPKGFHISDFFFFLR